MSASLISCGFGALGQRSGGRCPAALEFRREVVQRAPGVPDDALCQRRLPQGVQIGFEAHGSTGRLPQASSLNLALTSGLNPMSFEVRSISASIASRRAFDLIGPMPFEAERPLARDTGLAVLVRFFVVAMSPGYHRLQATRRQPRPSGPAAPTKLCPTGAKVQYPQHRPAEIAGSSHSASVTQVRIDTTRDRCHTHRSFTSHSDPSTACLRRVLDMTGAGARPSVGTAPRRRMRRKAVLTCNSNQEACWSRSRCSR